MARFRRNMAGRFQAMRCVLGAVICVVALHFQAYGAVASANAVIAERGAIFTYLLETGRASSARLPAAAIDEKPDWTVLDEEDTAHAFAGDAVLLNDKIAVVLRKGAAGAEVYARAASGHVSRGVLAPRCVPGDEVTGLSSIAIAENQAGAVSVRARFATGQGKTLALDYRLATGQILVELQPHEGMDALNVDVPAEFLVVPDFFGDDLVYAPRLFARPVSGLPAENFYLHLVDGGNAVVTCLWQSSGRNVRARVSGSGAITSEIECVEGKTLWVAFAENARVWHGQTASAAAVSSGLPLDWTPPFAAKWRSSFFDTSEAAVSSNFLGQPPEGNSSAASSPVTVVSYPIDRTQETPLDVYCLVDLMRATLGFGACQYILDVEGLDAQTSPTPALVMEWVEKQFEKKKDARYADDIRERCRLMAEHVGHAEQRVARYQAFAAEVRKTGVSEGPARDGVLRILDDLDRAVAQTAALRATPEAAAALAQQVVDLTGKEGAYAECRRIGDALRAQGAAQDRALAKCRMAVRRLKQFSLGAAEGGDAAFMRAILMQTEGMLSGKRSD